MGYTERSCQLHPPFCTVIAQPPTLTASAVLLVLTTLCMRLLAWRAAGAHAVCWACCSTLGICCKRAVAGSWECWLCCWRPAWLQTVLCNATSDREPAESICGAMLGCSGACSPLAGMLLRGKLKPPAEGPSCWAPAFLASDLCPICFFAE